MLSSRIRFIALLLPLLLAHVGQAQGTIQGIVLDSTARTPMAFVNLLATRIDDSTRWTGGITDVEGRFSMGPLAPGRYRLKA